MKRFELLTGQHVGEDGTKYTKGALIESPYDLVKMFPNKFKRLASNPSEDEEVTDTGSDEDNPPKGENEDVTDKFPDAVEAGLKVHKVDKLYVVTDPDDEGLLHEEELSSKAKVKAFIVDYVAD